MSRFVFAALLVFSFVAVAGPKKQAKVAKAGSAAAGQIKLPKAGLTFEGPSSCTVTPMGDAELVSCNGYAFSVGPAGEYSAKSLADAKSNAEMFNPTKITKEEAIEGGWNFQFQNKGDMGENFFVNVGRTFNGKLFICEASQSNTQQQAQVEKACLSLK